MDRFAVMQLFAWVVETGSFSKAAQAAGVGQPAVSKQIAALERRLGAHLLRRTTRGLSVTAAGRDYYDSAVRLLGELQAAESRVSRHQSAPEGSVRVAIPAGFGAMYVVPRLPEFFARYPGVALDFAVAERHVNLVEDGIDVAIQIGRLADSSLSARRIGSIEAVTVATPGYLERHGEPKHPEELAHHACVAFVFDGKPRPWEFRRGERALRFLPRGPMRTNDAEYIRAAVLAGLGLAQTASWLFAAEVASGAVVRVLADDTPAFYPIHAVAAGGRRVPRKVKVLVDFLAQVFAEHPSLRLRGPE
ncbi:DNA-binding transcriptional regulator, LysR family [Nannocystis exedens]|uniref:DNA-binding transcriptional regulator, LysR family n=1 Tax=Nannocystis exedens TaxID=54 RepID=A0A1I1V6E5_9BACT|nr:LysR family transcriptional regulator [Nannocystis exedens]PCC72322.1 LysR family transcriptional regulator [Nannocystis exedens]SFD77598.1 DNA-binding transcriptional regulator, LysR family [Nannocystis exedens]